jgi:hypothetical protein
MGWYELAKVVHFMGLIALFGFFVIYARAGERLRAAGTLAEARAWLGMLEATRGMLPGGAGMFIVSGATMAALRWRGAYPFMVVGFVTLLAIWVLWAMVGPRHLRAMRAVVGDAEGPVSPAVARAILEPAPWGTTGALNGAALGVLFVMTTKVGWVAAIAIVVLLATLVGGVFTTLVRRRRDGVASGRVEAAA